MIIENVTGVYLNQYIAENFLNVLKLTDLKLLPQDSVDYLNLAHPHCYPNTFMNFVGDGETPIDIMTVIKNANELLAKCSWAAGGMVGTADKVAIWGYNLFSVNGLVSSDIRDVILDSLANFGDNEEEYGFASRKLHYKGVTFLVSYGRSLGSENLMFYNPDKDICITILTNSNMKKNNTPNIDELMYSIYEAL